MSTTTDPGTVVSRVEMLVQMGRPERALDEVDAALAATPDDPRLLVTAGWVRLRLQRSAEAVPLLEQVVAGQPAAHGALYLLSIAQQNTGDVAAARDSAGRALELDPDDARYHLQIADVHLVGKVRRADRALARERISSALELAPEDPDRLLQAARLWSRLGDDDTARTLVRRGLAVAPQHVDLLYLDAALSTDAGRSAKGFGAVLAQNPEHAEAGYVLHLSVWQQVLRLVEAPVLLVGAVALVVTFTMSDALVGSTAIWGVVVLVGVLVTALRAVPVLVQVPPGLLRRTLRWTPWRRGTTVALVVGWVGVVAALVLLYGVRDAVAVRWSLVGLAGVLLLSGATSVMLHRAMLAQARDLGYYPPGRAGAARLTALRSGLRAETIRRLVVVGIPAVVVLAIGAGGLAREDGRGVAALAAVAWTLPGLLALWFARSLLARVRAAGPDGPRTGVARTVRAVVGGAVLALTTAIVALAGVVALVAVPVVPNEHDADGRYVQVVRDPSDGSTSSCTGRPVTRIGCLQREREERLDEMQERMEDMEVPTFDVPDVEIPDFDLPSVPPLDVEVPGGPTP
ncbi:tetratricopeptide repeat protein [Cellulosimicrobium sp. Marseille-Q8652]